MLGCNFVLISHLPRLYDLLQRSRTSVSSIRNVAQVRAERVLICRLGKTTLWCCRLHRRTCTVPLQTFDGHHFKLHLFQLCCTQIIFCSLSHQTFVVSCYATHHHLNGATAYIKLLWGLFITDMEFCTLSYLSVTDCWLYQRNTSTGVEVQGECVDKL
jgi:hypothetical protein